MDQGTLRCELVHGRRAHLARESVVQEAPFLVAAEIHEIQGSDRAVNTILSVATAIEPAWLGELFPGAVESQCDVRFDANAKRIVSVEREMFRELELSAKRAEPPPTGTAARLLADEILGGRLSLPGWDHSVEQWILRLNLLARWAPDLGLPGLGEADRRHLLEQVCHGAFGAKDLRDRDVRRVVQEWLSQAQRAVLDQHAPERLTLANGRSPKVVYDRDNPPYCALRIQELYGVKSVPRIAQGQVAVVLRILAPNMRPVQVTQDLEGFWRDHYPKLKQELQRKYPKHEWK
jgi:ATP-dependent helicase HrpB